MTPDGIRVSQTALDKAGAIGLRRSLNPDEPLSELVKYMAVHSALASGKSKLRRKGDTSRRRRHGDFVLMMQGGVVVDFIALRKDWCPECLGVDRESPRCLTCK